MSDEERNDETETDAEIEGHGRKVGVTDEQAEDDENDFEAHRTLYPNVRMD